MGYISSYQVQKLRGFLDDHYQVDPVLSLWRFSHTRKIVMSLILSSEFDGRHSVSPVLMSRKKDIA